MSDSELSRECPLQQSTVGLAVGGAAAAGDGQVQVDVDAVGVGCPGGVLGAGHVVLRLGGRLGDDDHVDAAHAGGLLRLGGDGLEDRHDEAGAGGRTDEHEALKGVPVDGRAVGARHEAGELGVGVPRRQSC